MATAESVRYVPFGRHVAIIELAGDGRDDSACRDLVDAVARAVEADRTAIVIDARRAEGMSVDLLSAVFDIHLAGQANGWRVGFVRPAAGPLRTLFQETGGSMSLTVFTTRAATVMWAMAGRRPTC